MHTTLMQLLRNRSAHWRYVNDLHASWHHEQARVNASTNDNIREDLPVFSVDWIYRFGFYDERQLV
jgi:hypothetical protein